ncbi:MAG: type II toxin-antitoxin system Phd/YefM family antitoxin [Bryobacteraceae bacterium]
MKIATISETKNRLSSLIDRVRHGESVIIVDRNRPVARLEPVVADEKADPDGRLMRLERAGFLRRGRASAARRNRILRVPPPKPLKGGDILKALLADREQSR